ncbi:9455_t:CDS:2, partial [Funneliformis geosporum]
WSSSIPNYNPQEIVDNLKRLINNEETVKMHPWNRGFQNYGKISFNDDLIPITELPIRVWTQNYKELLEKCISGTDKLPWILVRKLLYFSIKLSSESLKDSLEEGLEKRFMMSSPIGTSNLVCFDGAKVVFENMILPKKFQRNFTHTGSITIIRGREITYVPALYKVMDEIFVNAADNKVRDQEIN